MQSYVVKITLGSTETRVLFSILTLYQMYDSVITRPVSTFADRFCSHLTIRDFPVWDRFRTFRLPEGLEHGAQNLVMNFTLLSLMPDA